MMIKDYLHAISIIGTHFYWPISSPFKGNGMPTPQKQNQRKVRRDARRRSKR